MYIYIIYSVKSSISLAAGNKFIYYMPKYSTKIVISMYYRTNLI